MYKGKKTVLSNNKIQVDLMKTDEIIETHIVDSDVYANAFIIPWVSQKGYTDMTITSDTHVVDWDNFDEIYLYKE